MRLAHEFWSNLNGRLFLQLTLLSRAADRILTGVRTFFDCDLEKVVVSL